MKTQEFAIIGLIKEKCQPILIGYGGSIAYGTNLPSSDTDIRGIYMNPLNEFIGIQNSEQYQIPGFDATIYSIKKMFNLLLNCNPNVIEMLGLKDEHYLLLTDEGRNILSHADIFLSKRAAKSFGGYANAQLNRLMNRSGRALEQISANETRSMQKALLSLRAREGFGGVSVEEKNGMPVVTFNGTMPVEKFLRISQELNNIHADYRNSSRNERAADHGKLAKHMMHLIRLYMMAVDILREQKVITFREKEHDLLMNIRLGKYLEDDGLTPKKEFGELLDNYKAEFDKAIEGTELPSVPDYEAADRLMMETVRSFYKL